ncbi:MAG TPA: M12 family metallopeptidase [Bryobacteraceae bacterium]|jgi:uncharacterized protein (TIGR03437 family)
MRTLRLPLAALGTLLFLTQTLPAQISVELGQTIFRGRAVTYRVVHGHAILEGDLDLGPLEKLQPQALVPNDSQLLWPGGVIPYAIDSNVPNPQRISDAIALWTSQTALRFNPRSKEGNYITFSRTFLNNQICASAVGMTGGPQTLSVDDLCTSLDLAHSLGHAIGLYGEHTRADRDFYVTPNSSNIDKRYLPDYALSVPIASEQGPYDYASLMHFGRYARAADRNLITLETIPAGIPLDGVAVTGISAGDIDAVNRLYPPPISVNIGPASPPATTITSNPPGLQVLIDGSLSTTPALVNWSFGSAHTVDVPAVQRDGTPTRYLFARWSDNGAKSHTVTASADVSVFTVHFVRQFQFTNSVSPASAGTVKVTPLSPDGYYTEGTALSLLAAPATGYQFLTWNNTAGSILTNVHGISAANISFLLSQPGLNYIATFATASTNLLLINTVPPELPVSVNATILPAPRNISAAAASTVTVSAAPTISFGTGATRYVFTGWNDSGAATHLINLPKTGQFGTVTALYKTQHLVTTATLGPGSLTVTPSSPDGYYDDGAQITITAAPSSGAQLTRWDGDASGSTLVQTITVKKQIAVQATFQQPFTLSAANIVNAASFLFTPVSPGEIVTIFGLNIGPPSLVQLALDLNGKVETSLASCSILFDGIAAPLVYVSPNQLAAVVPYGVAGHSTTSVQISLSGSLSNAVTLPVGATSPALFSSNSSGRGPAAIVNQDGTLNGPLNPAAKGTYVLLFGTGEGQTNPKGLDGSVAKAPNFPAPLGAVSVLIGGPPGIGVPAQLLYAGAAPGDVAGVLQIDAVIPFNVPSGQVPISFAVAGSSSYDMATISIQ